MNMRPWLAETYCRGYGLDIGAFHNPFPINPLNSTVDYLDKRTTEECRKMADEDKNLGSHVRVVNVKIVDCGETLKKVKNSTYDFVISSHQLEHCFNPLRGVFNHLRVTKPRGYVIYMLPDMRQTFDKDRELTPYHHFVHHFMYDPKEGFPAQDMVDHHSEYLEFVDKITDGDARQKEAERRTELGYDVHFHTWTSDTMIEMFQNGIKELGENYSIEFFYHDRYESYVVLRKNHELD